MGDDYDRPNVISRLRGRGDAPPLLLYGHIDVVPTAAQPWDVPPFEGRLQDNYVWGRGALDMKGGVAMMMDAFMRAHLEGADLPGDVILALVTDEEAGGFTGAGWLVDNHPKLFEGVSYGIGEFGGFSKTYRGRKFYMVQVAEKQGCRVQAVARGLGGHGSLVHHDTAPTRMAKFPRQARCVAPAVSHPPGNADDDRGDEQSAAASRQYFPAPVAQPHVHRAYSAPHGYHRQEMEPLFRHTSNATVIAGGEKTNVIPSEVTVNLDCRMLPGYSAEDLVGELQDIAGPTIEFEVLRFEPKPWALNMGLFDTLAKIVEEQDPDGISVPMLMPAWHRWAPLRPPGHTDLRVDAHEPARRLRLPENHPRGQRTSPGVGAGVRRTGVTPTVATVPRLKPLSGNARRYKTVMAATPCRRPERLRPGVKGS